MTLEYTLEKSYLKVISVVKDFPKNVLLKDTRKHTMEKAI